MEGKLDLEKHGEQPGTTIGTKNKNPLRGPWGLFLVLALLLWVPLRPYYLQVSISIWKTLPKYPSTGVEPIGTVRWGACAYPDALPNAECGYIM